MSLEVLLKKIGGQVIEIILINESHWSGLTIQVALIVELFMMTYI